MSWNSGNTGSFINIAKFKNYANSFCRRSYFAITNFSSLQKLNGQRNLHDILRADRSNL